MNLVAGGVLLILGGAAAALLLRNHPRLADSSFLTLVLAGCALGGTGAVQVLLGGQGSQLEFSSTLPGGPWIAGLDRLSAWFVLLCCLVAAATASYGVTYLAHDRPRRRLGPPHAMFAVLVTAMLGVFVAQAVVLFLMAWELMALSAYFLILYDHDRDDVRRAGMVYLVLTHVGTLALLGMFLTWGRSSADLSFAQLTPAAAHFVWGGAPILVLAVIGFGIKAGIFPFHFWLPGAHASAPSHASALLSGVMLKTGIYGLLRVLTLFGEPPRWWAWGLLILGVASAVLGVLWALTQRDLKRALAYSSVDNIGIIVMGIALGALGSAYHHPVLALLGFTAALLHVMNHALFKGILFLGAGAVARATGTLQIDRLGGLARVLPKTGWAFLLGSVAIIGLPSLNGFVGEWTLVRGFLAAGGGGGAVRFAGVGAAVIGLVGALTLACFLRLGTTVFLGQPRTGELGPHEDATGGMTLGMALLGSACLVIGVVPGIVVAPALQVATMVSSEARAAVVAKVIDDTSMLAITTLVATLVVLCAVLWGVRLAAGRHRSWRTSGTWRCAYAVPTVRMQYTGASFTAPVSRAFAVSDPFAVTTASASPDGRRDDRVLRGFAVPAWGRVMGLALQFRPLQQGRVTTYLQYIIATVLLLLGFLFFAGLNAPR